jgi:hypothetical protein
MRLLNHNDHAFEQFCDTILPTFHTWSDVMAWGDKHGVRFDRKAINKIYNHLRRRNDRKQRRKAQRNSRIGEMPERVTKGEARYENTVYQ